MMAGLVKGKRSLNPARKAGPRTLWSIAIWGQTAATVEHGNQGARRYGERIERAVLYSGPSGSG